MGKQSLYLLFMFVKELNSIYLYGQKGKLDRETETILFKIKFQPNLINKIEDQGELADIQNVRDIQFKFFDQESILLYFKYKELVRFVELEYDQVQELDKLIIMTIKSIFNLNKKSYKLMNINPNHLLATKDGQIYFYHFEQNDNYDYTCERKIIEFIITFYLDKQITWGTDNYDKLLIFEEYRSDIYRLSTMTEMLNHKLFQWLFSQRDFDISRLKTLSQDMLEFYKHKESKKVNIREQFLYRFPPQLIEVQWKQRIETLLFKIYALDAFQDKVSKSLIGQDNTKLYDVINKIKLRLIKQISQELNLNYQDSFKCLRLTIQHYLKGSDQDKAATEKQITQESFTPTYFRYLKEAFNSTKNVIYLYQLAYLSIIKHLDDEYTMCPIIDQIRINDKKTISLPYEYVGFEEIGQLLISKNDQVIRQFLKGGCYKKVPNQEIN
ncbi:hypothetical protein pb186bvf_017072 [Paramecium bursaria]